MRVHPILFCWRRVGSGEDGRLTVAVEDLLPSSNHLWCPNGGDGAKEGHAGVGAAGMVQEADDRKEGCGKAHLLGVGNEVLFRSWKSKRRKGKNVSGHSSWPRPPFLRWWAGRSGLKPGWVRAPQAGSDINQTERDSELTLVPRKQSKWAHEKSTRILEPNHCVSIPQK